MATKIYGFLLDHDRLNAVVAIVQSSHLNLVAMMGGLLDRVEQ